MDTETFSQVWNIISQYIPQKSIHNCAKDYMDYLSEILDESQLEELRESDSDLADTLEGDDGDLV